MFAEDFMPDPFILEPTTFPMFAYGAQTLVSDREQRWSWTVEILKQRTPHVGVGGLWNPQTFRGALL